ncbi:MAG TPA: multidrug transporter, partial [Terriglobia bacterium]|nr:multidrug transporter [Terriglobia bacterium]
AQKQVEIARWSVQQAWGGSVAGWVVQNSPNLKAVLNQRAVLVRVTLPPGNHLQEDPSAVTLSAPSGRSADASYVSPFPQVDPRIQGVSLLYIARSYPTLEPGMNLAARLPTGKLLRGVLIPRAAIVWWQGQAWVYEQTVPGRYVRRLVSTDEPFRDGYFAAQGFAPGVMVVTHGAEELLSEEFRSQIQAED